MTAARRNSLLLALSAVSLVLVAVVFGRLWSALWDIAGYARASVLAFCEGTLDLVGSNAPYSSLAIVAVAAAMGVLGATSVVRQVGRARSVTKSLLEGEITPLPGSLSRVAARLGLDGRLRLVDSPGFHAFCFGLLRPEVCISSAVVEQLPLAEIEAVLRHESWHVRHRDPLNVLVANALGAALFFLPVLRDLTRHYVVKRELAADAATVRDMNDAYPLASALHKAVTIHTGSSQLQATVGAFSALDARIDQLVGDTGESAVGFRPRRSSVFLSLLAIVTSSVILCHTVTLMQPGGVVGV